MKKESELKCLFAARLRKYSPGCGKACISGVIPVFQMAHLKNTFIFHFQLSIFHSSCIRSFRMQTVL